MHVDSLLKHIHGTGPEWDGGPGTDLVVSSAEDGQDFLDGMCTLTHLFMTAFRKACDACDKDILAEEVPRVLLQLRRMTRNVAPSAILAMAAMMTASAIGVSPNGWRAQYGDWLPAEVTAVVATALVLAEEINSAHEDDSAALRMIIDALTRAEEDQFG